MSAPAQPTSPHERQAVKHTAWRKRLALLLGTGAALSSIPTDGLERARDHYRHSPHPDAWLAHTLVGAELERRQPRIAPRPSGLTAAEIAWTEQRERRAVA